MKLFLAALAAGGVLALSAGSASAMPINNLAAAAPSDLQDVRLVCTRSGRCYHTRPRYRSRAYYAPRGYYAPPAYGYGQPSYGYGGPAYGYGHRSYGGPGIGLNFRF
jgi:hypothetical protein